MENTKQLKCFLLLVIFSCLIFGSTAQNVIRGPYLQLGTPNSMIIRWRTDRPTDSKVWFGSSPSNLTSMEFQSGSRTEHEMNLTGLTPNTTYFYAVGNNAAPLAGGDSDHYFNTAPPHGASQPVSIWVLGDCGTGNDNQRTVRDAFYDFNRGPHSDLILLLGDNAYEDGTDEDHQQALFENMYEASLINSVMWPTIGNHDIHSSNSQTESGPYYDIFNCPKNGEAGGVPSGTEAYYSFDYANIHFISLNTEDINNSPTSPMVTWLKDDIASTSQEWIVAFFHKEPYYTIENFRVNVLPVLEAGGVDLVMYGHRHIYSRSYLMNGHYGSEGTFDPRSMAVDRGDGRMDGDDMYEKPPGITPNAGTIYLTSGSAGLSSNDLPNFPFVISQTGWPELGSVHIRVSGRQMNVKFILEDGSVRDHFSIHKGVGARPRVRITSPADGMSYPSTQTITITADASDPGGKVTKAEFFANGASIGADDSAPYSLDWNVPTEDIYDIYAVVTDDDGNAVESSVITIEVGVFSRCFGISHSANDAEQSVRSGSVSLNSSDLELGTDLDPQIVGMRFQNSNIPKNAHIIRANIQFTVDEFSDIDPCYLYIYGEGSANPEIFAGAKNDLGSRPQTQAFVFWSPNSWQEINDAGPSQKTPDIQAVIQEIVNQPGFTSGSPISIFIKGSGRRVAHSFDKEPIRAPKLCVVYQNNNTGFECLSLQANIGDPCDDNDPGTVHDVIQADCSCSGDLLESRLEIFPNPANQELKIRARLRDLAKGESVHLVLYQADGETVVHQELIPLFEEGMEHLLLDISHLHSGLYFVGLYTGHDVVTNRFIKIGD